MRLKSCLAGLLLIALLAPVTRAEESTAEKLARDWFLSAIKGERAKVVKMTRVPFAAGDILIPTQQQAEQYVFSSIGKSDNKKVADVTAEMIKVKTLDNYRSSNPASTHLMETVAAHQFVQISIGDTTLVIYLTKGVKPKVVGFSK
jgi:hypothetical protein